ncbi:MAG: hypothetical protein KDC18_06370 [Alphaproteobacteria bacterium]|nr:hypothetical protein [Alphaproteobacteria bacterium]MCB9931620.1 hypothetical protein [Alphaproteobacteria bacterium]
MMFNTDAYNRLPQQYKDLVWEFKRSDQAYPAQIAAYTAKEVSVPKMMRERGLTEVKIGKTERTAFEKAGGEPVWHDWARQMTEEFGYNGDELLNLILTSAKKNADK